jgi:hypothetical protein
MNMLYLCSFYRILRFFDFSIVQIAEIPGFLVPLRLPEM